MAIITAGRGGVVKGVKYGQDLKRKLFQDVGPYQIGVNEIWTWGSVSTDAPFTGQRSILLDTPVSGFCTDKSSQFNTASGNWTYEMWVKLTVTSGERLRCADFRDLQNFVLYINNGNLNMNNGTNYATTNAITANVWTHIAFVKNGTNFSMYIGGTAGYSATPTANITPATPYFSFLNITNAAYIYDIRFTVGTAVYTGNFTPPSAPLEVLPNTKLLLKAIPTRVADTTGY